MNVDRLSPVSTMKFTSVSFISVALFISASSLVRVKSNRFKMQSKEENNLILVRLFPGEDIYHALKEVCRKYKVETAVVLSGLGQLKHFELGYFKEKENYTPQEFDKPYELLSLTGNISLQEGEYNFHLHAVLGNEEKDVVGGHLIEGTVEVTNEIVLLKTSLKVKRKLEEKTGLQEMLLED